MAQTVPPGVGLVILGKNAEAFLSTPGYGAHYTKQVLELISDAKDAGANSVMVLPPGYFGKATKPEIIERFYADISKGRKLPIIIYNFLGVFNGVDISSAEITKLVNKHENIVGTKLTCGTVAKITRLAAALPNVATFGGQSDCIISGLSSGSVGCIAAFANVFPKTIVRIDDLYRGRQAPGSLGIAPKGRLSGATNNSRYWRHQIRWSDKKCNVDWHSGTGHEIVAEDTILDKLK
ncbi:putative Dihydrodipicolinate synthetase [Seiridium cardinale]|uniref:Dihydrodipicolinate synthetase n=1 Tax=Seiridium cardinale TaxID=138064 RepID=A0ABR2Y1Z5_9PEZI